MSIQAKCALQAALIETTAGTSESQYLVMPHPGEWQIDACYFTPNATVSGHASNTVTLSVKQGSTAVCTAILIDDGSSGTNGLTAGTKLTFTVAAAGSSLVFGQGDVLHVAATKASSGIKCVGDMTVSFKQVVS